MKNIFNPTLPPDVRCMLRAYFKYQCMLGLRTFLGVLGFYSGFVGLWRWLRRGRPGHFLILMYHRVHDRTYGTSEPVTRRNFRRQMRYLKRHFDVITLDELCKRLSRSARPPRDCVAITFDDGYADNYSEAFPILREYGLPALIYLTTGFIGTEKKYWWDRLWRALQALEGRGILGELPRDLYPENIFAAILFFERAPRRRKPMWNAILETLLKRLPDDQKNRLLADLERRAAPWIGRVPDGPRALTWDEVRDMARQGVAFGGHTISHAILSRLSLPEARREIEGCQAAITQNVGRPATQFAFPNGRREDFNPELQQLIREAGFTNAVVATRGPIRPGEDLLAIHRIPVPNGPLACFALELTLFKRTLLHRVFDRVKRPAGGRA